MAAFHLKEEFGHFGEMTLSLNLYAKYEATAKTG